MKTRRLLIASFLMLAIGIGLLIGYCKGSAGFSAVYPLSSTEVKFDITTSGVPAIVGVPVLALGLVLLIASAGAAIIGEIRSRRLPTRPDYEQIAERQQGSLH